MATTRIRRRQEHRRRQRQMTPPWFWFWLFLTTIFLLHQNNNPHTNPSKGLSNFFLSKIGCYAAETTSALRKKPSNEELELLEHSNQNEKASSSSSSSSSGQEIKQQELKLKRSLPQILKSAAAKGLGGGIPGAIAGAVQVLTLMWLRTVINYQSRYGTTFLKSLKVLYKQGGIPRFYRGLWFALIQAPVSRFVSTAANDGVQALCASLPWTRQWGPARTTVLAGIVVGLWRMVLMPIDTCKTVLQIDSAEGFRNLRRRVAAGKISVLYQGAVANSLSSFLGHYPWFYTYNFLTNNKLLTSWVSNALLQRASIGMIASFVSDTSVNAIRVIKLTKQSIGSTKHDLSYLECIRMVVAADGWRGLFLGRGLKTRLLANALQSIVFTVIWRGLADRFFSRKEEDEQRGPAGSNAEHEAAVSKH